MKQTFYAALFVAISTAVWAQPSVVSTLYTLKKGESIRPISEHTINMDANKGEFVLFTEREVGDEEYEYYTIINGKEYGPNPEGYIDYASYSFFGEGGNYALTDWNDDQTEMMLTVNGKKFGPFTGVSDQIFTKQHYGFITYATDEDDETTSEVYIDGKKIDSAPGIYGLTIEQGDKLNYAYYTEDNGNYTMVHNGKKHGPYTSLNYPSLVAGHYGWTYTDKNEQQVVVIDGKEYGPYTSAMAPYFNTDGSYMIEIEKKDKQGWLLNGKEFWVDKSYGGYLNLQGKYVATYERNGKTYINVNGKEEKNELVANNASWDISPSANHYWVSTFDEEAQMNTLYVDGKKVNDFPSELYGVTVEDNGALSYIHVQDGITTLLFDGKEYKLPQESNLYDWNLNSTYLPERYALYITPSGDAVFLYNNKKNKILYNPDDEYGQILTPLISKGHYLSYNPDVPEDIIIDNTLYKGDGGFAYFYNPNANAFQWLAVKGNTIQLKEFKLK
jgi:hypothetical protein